jgi:hypothetical protein
MCIVTSFDSPAENDFYECSWTAPTMTITWKLTGGGPITSARTDFSFAVMLFGPRDALVNFSNKVTACEGGPNGI